MKKEKETETNWRQIRLVEEQIPKSKNIDSDKNKKKENMVIREKFI